MHTQHEDRRFSSTKGFTVIELLFVLAIIGLILGILIASLSSAKDKAADARVKHTISEIAVKAEEQEIAPGVVDYSRAFDATKSVEIVKSLAVELRVPEGAYDFEITPTEYVVVFPLRTGKYWCVDSHRTVGEVAGRLTAGGRSCADATGIGIEEEEADGPTLTLLGDNPVIIPMGFDDSADRYVEPGATAIDARGNNISNTISISAPVYYSTFPGCTYTLYLVTYTVTSDDITVTKTRDVKVRRSECSSGGGPVDDGEDKEIGPLTEEEKQKEEERRKEEELRKAREQQEWYEAEARAKELQKKESEKPYNPY